MEKALNIIINRKEFQEVLGFYLEKALKEADGKKYIIRTIDGERKITFKITSGRRWWERFLLR